MEWAGLNGKTITVFFDDAESIKRKTGTLRDASAAFVVLTVDGVDTAIPTNRVIRFEVVR